MVLRCTQKALKLLVGRDTQLGAQPPSADDWYANLLWIERRKNLLITHAGTLFSVFAPDVRKPDLTPPGPYITSAISNALHAEGLPSTTLGSLHADDLELAKTASRSVLGHMNDIATHITYATWHAGGLAHIDPTELNRHLQRTLHNYQGTYRTPLDLIHSPR